MRKFIAYCCIVSMALSISGCSSTGNNANTSHSITEGTNKNPGVEEKKEKQSGGTASVDTLQYITKGEYSLNDNGYYYIEHESENSKIKDGTWAKHIMYMDFATKQEVYLCNNTGCKHDNENCTSVLPFDCTGNSSELFLYNNYLYLLDKDYDNEGSISTNLMLSEENSVGDNIEGKQAVLYRINLDGTGKTKVYAFDENLTVENIVMADGEGLYFVTKKMETNQLENNTFYHSSEKKLIRLDTTTWQKDEVLNLQLDEKKGNWNVYGCFESYLVLERILYEHEQTDEERMKEMNDENYERQNLLNAKHQFAIVNIHDGVLKEVYTTSKAVLSSFDVQNGILYVGLDGDECIKKIDLKSGKESVFAKLKANNIRYVFDDVICCETWDKDENNMDNTFYFLNCKDKSVTHSSLTNKSLGWELEIIGETKDAFLVIYDYEATASGEGNGSYEITRNQYGLIAKEDLYNGIDNFQPIQMACSGIAE